MCLTKTFRQGLAELDWKLAGAQLANCGDREQAEFLKSFVKECLSWGTRCQVEVQLAHVNHLLTDEEKSVLSMISYIDRSEI